MAALLALGGAEAAKDRGEGQILLDQGQGLFFLTAQDKLHISLAVHTKGTTLPAGGQFHAKIIKDAGLHTDTAKSAFILVYPYIVRKGFQWIDSHYYSSTDQAILIMSLY
jgi:hypothetical protein